MKPLIKTVIAASAAAAVLSGCTTVVGGSPTAAPVLPGGFSPTEIDQNSPRTELPKQPLPTGTDPRDKETVDTLRISIKVIKRFWADTTTDLSNVKIKTVSAPSKAPECRLSSTDHASSPPAWACSDLSLVVVDVTEMTKLHETYGALGVHAVIAHEFGHIALPKIDPATDTGDELEERRADCIMGATMAWGADNSADPDTNHSLLTKMFRKMFSPERLQPRLKAVEAGTSQGLEVCATYRP